MKTVDVSIVIVSFNTRDLLYDCIQSIEKTVKEKSYEIIIVDNASRDDSVEFLEKHYKNRDNIIVIANKENFGFSKANNIGVEKSKGRYVLFLNPDTVVREQTISGMIDFMDENLEAGASTCYLEMPNGKLDDASHRGFPTPWRALSHFSGLSKSLPKSKLFGGYNLSWMDLKQTHEIEALAGAFMLVRRSAGEEVGWWDEDFFWYGDDLDFCFRLKEKKWKIFFVPQYTILHYKGVAGGIKKISKDITTADSETKARAIDSRFKAMRIFYDKHYKKKYPKFVTAFVLLGIDLKWRVTKLKYAK